MGPQKTYLQTTDPTVLTTEQLHREIQGLKELIGSRLNAMDKALDLMHEDYVRIPTDTDEQVSALKELVFEKVVALEKSIQLQLHERDIRTNQATEHSRLAIDAALQAAKELVGEQNRSSNTAIIKSETSVSRQMEQFNLLLQTMGNSISDKFGDIKDRITRAEGAGSGKMQSEAVHRSSNTFLIAAITTFIAFVSTITAIIMAVRK